MILLKVCETPIRIIVEIKYEHTCFYDITIGSTDI